MSQHELSRPGSLTSFTVTPSVWGRLPRGKGDAQLLTMQSPYGATVCVSTYGATIVSFSYANGKGEMADVVLGFENLEGYLGPHPYMGAVVGRCANRIAEGHASILGKEVSLSRNSGNHHLHGGVNGWDKKNWRVEKIGESKDCCFVELSHLSPDGDEGYPGEVTVRVRYTLSGPAWVAVHNNSLSQGQSPRQSHGHSLSLPLANRQKQGTLRVDYNASTSEATLLNPTQHSYFNLNGGGRSVIDHDLQVDAAFVTATHKDNIPTGELLNLNDTCFTGMQNAPVPLESLLSPIHPQLQKMGGVDHNFVLSPRMPANADGDFNPAAAQLFSVSSGRYLCVGTNSCGLQVYTLNEKHAHYIGKRGCEYKQHWGVCLETQYFPDAIHHPHFESCVLLPANTFHGITTFEFGALTQNIFSDEAP